MNDEIYNPLNLNNLPVDFNTRENGKQAQLDAGSSSTGQISKRKKKDDESGKVYECRFCSLKFCKSQALGGHMNRHRPERETETLNKARMLVFSNENSISTVHGLPAHHLEGFRQPMVDPTLHFRPAYSLPPVQTRLPTSTQSTSSLLISHTPQLYPSPPRPHSVPYPSHQYPPSNEYYVRHVLGITGPETTHYTCIGAPIGPSNLGNSDGIRENGAPLHTSFSNGYQGNTQDDGLTWGMRGFGGTSSHQQPQPAQLDLSLAINRFQEKF